MNDDKKNRMAKLDSILFDIEWGYEELKRVEGRFTAAIEMIAELQSELKEEDTQ